MRMRLSPWLTLLLAVVALGCAKFPSGGDGTVTKRLVFHMHVNGKLRSGMNSGEAGLPYVYVVALRVSTEENPIDQGPIPVVIPGGNGMVAGNATHYVLWNPLASPSYQIWQFSDASMNQAVMTGVPVNYIPVELGGKELFFEVDLSQLVPKEQVDSIKSVQVNFLTMNNTNTSGGGRMWDALGNSQNLAEINSYLTLHLRSNQTYNNTNSGNLEPTGDVADPDLDMDDWSVEVRL